MNRPINIGIQPANSTKIAQELIIRYINSKPKQEQMDITDSITRLIRSRR